MAYITTPDLGLELADSMTIQAFETTNVNSNFLLLEAGIVADRVRISAEETKSAAIAAGAGRGDLARESALNAAALTAISDGVVGDKVLLTSPGTGISPFWAQMISGSGAGADWVPAETVIADTKANLDTFIAAWIGDADLTFVVGRDAFVTGTSVWYYFSSAGGALVAKPGVIASGSFTAVSTVTIDGLAGFSEYEIVLDVPTASVANDLTAQLLVSGVAQTTGYDVELLIGSAAVASAGQFYGASSWTLGSGNRADKLFRLNLHNLNAAARTVVQGYGQAKDVGANALNVQRSFWHTPATACTGIRFTTTSGTITGAYTARGIA